MEFKSAEDLKRDFYREQQHIDDVFSKSRGERENKKEVVSMENELNSIRKIQGDKSWLLKDGEKFDFTNKDHQYKYIACSLYKIKEYYSDYKQAINELKNNNKYSEAYKKEKKDELKKELFDKKDKELFNSKARLHKLRAKLEVADKFSKDKEDKILVMLEKMNLMNMIDRGLKYKDKSYIKSLIPEIAKHDDLIQVFKAEAGQSFDTVDLVQSIDSEYRKRNEKYIYLNELEKNIDTMRNYKDTIFLSESPTLDIRKCKLTIVK